MAELLTFKAAKESRELAKVSGVCASSDEFKSIVNQATRKLMRRGPGERAWWGTAQKLHVCVYGNCITWPRWVGTPIAVNTFGHPMPVRNSWFEFMPWARSDWNIGGGFRWRDGICSGNIAVADNGNSSVFRNIPPGKQFYIRAYPQSRLDIGKKMTIYGIDYNGQEIRTLRSDGTYQDGVEITIALPYGQTPITLRSISRVSKPVTQNVIRLFQYDAENDSLLDCAVYYPNETEPTYRTSIIHSGTVLRNSTTNSCQTNVQAMVKLEFVPVNVDTDLVLIDNLDALALMVLSIREFEGGNITESEEYEKASIRELNLQLEDKIPVDQTPISVQPFGTARGIRSSV